MWCGTIGQISTDDQPVAKVTLIVQRQLRLNFRLFVKWIIETLCPAFATTFDNDATICANIKRDPDFDPYHTASEVAPTFLEVGVVVAKAGKGKGLS